MRNTEDAENHRGPRRNPRGGRFLEDRYRRACSWRFVFFDPGFGAGDEDLLSSEFFFFVQEMAHERFWYCGSSHIFVQCLIPLSYAQWQ